MMFKYFHRTLYLGYYIKKLDINKFRKFFVYVNNNKNKTKLSLIGDIILSVYQYNISLLEYFNFKFYEISNFEKKSYAGAGFMYEYQLIMNPKKERSILEDKLLFLKSYAKFIRHKYISLNDLQKKENLKSIFSNQKSKIVLKSSKGQCGEGIEVRNISDFDMVSVIDRLKKTDNDFVEEYIYQHDKLNKLSPSGLNTVRLITQLNKDGTIDFVGARLRITINSSVDNLAAGNIAAPIDMNTGVVSGAGVYSDITKIDENMHPVTQQKIIGFNVPFWKESLEMVKEAALLHPQNRSIGWDIAITNEGPELLEGNHNWCRLLWQLPVKKGLKNQLEKYL